ncbi:IS3 family transposase [Pseudomonas syringae]|nr:IS3 family transposase [Pseudomonas syringae]WKF03063.1 IS3 family transposase [Pseudomonas syringae CC457]WKF03851.1 IS3 family transposase [Pseudomonas syringae CC457]
MGRYTEQAKLAAVQEYCAGKAGLRDVAHRHDVDFSCLRQWVAAYQIHGVAGLQEKKRQRYSDEFKLTVLKRMHDERLSLRQTAALFDIRQFGIIGLWQRHYEEGAFDASSKPPTKAGRPRKMTTALPPVNAPSIDDESRSRDELLAEVKQLRMEVDYPKKARCLGSEEATNSATEKAQIVTELRLGHSLDGLLKLAGLARSTFYYQQKVLQADDKYAGLKDLIQTVFYEHKGRYGYRRITAALRRAGHFVNHKTVQKLMGQLGLKSLVRVKKYRSYKGEVGKAAPNILKRDFKAQHLNEKWATDVTEFKVGGQKLYLSPIMDLYNGEIISYAIARRPLYSMVDEMLEGAFKKLEPHEKPILHSDQGWQYRMPVYQRLLNEHSITCSMSRKGNCYDNAAMESFFGTLKSEFFYLNKFNNLDELHAGIDEYIEYYNQSRIKLKLNGLSPVEFRMQAAQAA